MPAPFGDKFGAIIGPCELGRATQDEQIGLSHSIRNRLALALQHFNLPQLQNDIFGLLSFASHPLVLLKTG